MSPARFREAGTEDVARLARPLVAARVVADAAELEALHAAAPWRLRVNDSGDVVVLDRWRDHLPYLAIEALWCSSARIPYAVAHVSELADKLGFTDVISPPTPVEEAHAYELAGMRVHTTVLTYAMRSSAALVPGATPDGVTVRSAGPEDVTALLEVDSRCFSPFWCYDARHFERFLGTSHIALAEQDGQPLGYTLCTVSRDEGLLGRLGVVPEWRRRGLGSWLLRDAVRHAGENGCGHVVLSTQADNAAAQALYRAEHFRDTGRRYSFMHFGDG